MTVNEIVKNCIFQIENVLSRGNFVDDDIFNPLEKLRDQLLEIDKNSELIPINEKKQVILMIRSFESNVLQKYMVQLCSNVSSSIINILFDTIRLQINIDAKMDSFINDYYFDLSLKKLTDKSTINFLNRNKSQSENIIDIDEELFHFYCRIGSRCMHYKTVKSYSACVSRRKIPTYFELNDATEHFLCGLIIYLNKYFLNNSRQNRCHFAILVWLMNMTDIYGFIPYFIKTDYPQTILKWLSITDDREEVISIQTWRHVFGFLCNICRHPEGVNILNKLNGIFIIKEWKNHYINKLLLIESIEDVEDILIAYYLIYALLLEPKQLKQENIIDIENVLNRILEKTVLAFQSDDLRCGTYNLCEYLFGLSKFVVNDKYLLYIISHDKIFNLFLDKFLEFNQLYQNELNDLNTLICLSLYTIFWSISFQSQYRFKLKNIDKFLKYVEQMSKTQSNDEYTISMRNSAKGILFNFDLMQMDIENNNENNGFKVMISYSHRDTAMCQKVTDYLKKRLYGDIWVDFIKLTPPYEDDWEEIAKGISNCDVVITIVTDNYCSSKSCRREVIHADKRNKRIIPVYIGKDYEPEEWFEIRAGSATWVRFGDWKSDEDVLNTLFELVNAQDKVSQKHNQVTLHTTSFISQSQEIISQPTKNSIESVPSLPILNIVQNQTIASVNNKSIEELTKEEIEQLLKLPSSILELSSGRALLTYIHLLTNKDAQFDEYERHMRHRGLSREQFSNLISLLMNIRSIYNINIKSNKLIEQWTYNEIKDWFHKNHFSDYLLDIFAFTDGNQLITYAKLLNNSSTRINDEYEQLKHRIQSRYNGNYFLYLDEYARLISAFQKLIITNKN